MASVSLHELWETVVRAGVPQHNAFKGPKSVVHATTEEDELTMARDANPSGTAMEVCYELGNVDSMSCQASSAASGL